MPTFARSPTIGAPSRTVPPRTRASSRRSIRSLLAAAVDVGLGSDSVASNDRMDLLDEARQALLFATVRSRDVGALTAAKALELATLGGARALRLEREIGSLDVGKAADFAVFPLAARGRGPTHDP